MNIMIILQEPVVGEAKARLQEKYRTAQQLGEEVNFVTVISKGFFDHSLEQYSVGQIYENLNIMRYQITRRQMVQVRELKAALDTKQGNVSPDTLLALLEAANQEVEMS